jgi:NAD(P)-dependent dehydrogenase (short-subunit alcohol dehydrogenase family)
MFDLSNRAAAIVGETSGIGLTQARGLACAGAGHCVPLRRA